MQIINTRAGHEDYERHLGPILDNPPARIWADAEIDMRRRAHQDPHKQWWIAIDHGAVLAFCAAWPSDQVIECGHNYEMPGQGRAAGAYQHVFAARQRWVRKQRTPCVTWIFDQPVGLHLAAGWTRTGSHGVSADGHHWQELRWTPAS